MTSRRLVYKGRTIDINIPDLPHRTADGRCDECRANDVAVCTHQHPTPPLTTPTQQTSMPEHSHDDIVGMAEHNHGQDTAEGHAAEPAMPEGGHSGHGAFEIVVDGQSFAGHVFGDGRFHTHELPFVAFPTAEALAQAIVNKLEWSQPHGRPQKPEKTERS